MIIQIRGTSGSGKSTIVKELMKQYQWTPIYETGRKLPIGYEAPHKQGKIIVLGHYEPSAKCGGLDTIKNGLDHIDKLYRSLGATDNTVILSEGLFQSYEFNRTILLDTVRVVFLTTSIEECLERVRRRRVENGNLSPLNEHQTRSKFRSVELCRQRLINAGIDCRRMSQDQATKAVSKWVEEFCESRR